MDFKHQQDDLLIRTFALSEANLLFQMIDENREHLSRWFPWAPTIKTIHDVESFLKDERVKNTLEKGLYLGIWEKGKLVGIISLEKIDHINRKAELGYWLSQKSEGRGIMYKACKIIINHAFNKLQLHRIDVTHIQENARSENLIKKLGFTHEGTSQDSGLLNGKYVNHECYGLLISQWRIQE